MKNFMKVERHLNWVMKSLLFGTLVVMLCGAFEMLSMVEQFKKVTGAVIGLNTIFCLGHMGASIYFFILSNIEDKKMIAEWKLSVGI